MPTIFISYRREDTLDVCGRIYDRLELAFGTQQVLMDVDTIPPGVDFREYLERMVNQCDVFLAVMGPRWAGPLPDGARRIDDPDDFVRIEAELALKRGIPIMPLLVSGASMLSTASLPASLAPLAYRNAVVVRPNPDFSRDMERVTAGIKRATAVEAEEPSAVSLSSPAAPIGARVLPPARSLPDVGLPAEGSGLKASAAKRPPYLVRVLPSRVAAVLLAGGGLLGAIAFFLPWRIWSQIDDSGHYLGDSLVPMVSDVRAENGLWIIAGAAVVCLAVGILAVPQPPPLPLLRSAVLVAGVGIGVLCIEYALGDPDPYDPPGSTYQLVYHVYVLLQFAAPALGVAVLMRQLGASRSVGPGSVRRIVLSCVAAALAGALEELVFLRATLRSTTALFAGAVLLVLLCGASTLVLRTRRGVMIMYVVIGVVLILLPIALQIAYGRGYGDYFALQFWSIVGVASLLFLVVSYGIRRPRPRRTSMRFYLAATAIGLFPVVALGAVVTTFGFGYRPPTRPVGLWLALAGLVVAMVGAFALHTSAVWYQPVDATVNESAQAEVPVPAP